MYILRRISTGEIIKRNVRDEDAESVVGLDPDLEYLFQVVETVPDYDPRIFVLTRNEARHATEAQWVISWGTEKRDVEEIKEHIDNMERDQAGLHLPFENQLKILTLGLTVLFRALDGLQLTPKEQALRQRIISIGSKLWKNEQRANALKAAVDTGSEPDIDAGWEPED